jgi:hypothetical protein
VRSISHASSIADISPLCARNADPETGVALVPSQTRSLGLAVLRGTSLVVISPVDGCAHFLFRRHTLCYVLPLLGTR